MTRTRRTLVIDARPRGPLGLLAGADVRGRSVLERLLSLASAETGGGTGAVVPVHAPRESHAELAALLVGRSEPRSFVLRDQEPPRGAAVLRTDRLYDPARLRRALRRGHDPESAALWRLDRPGGLEGAGDELERRQSYQPLGRFWALAPARALARSLTPTRVRPNALTVASAGLVLTAAALVAWGSGAWWACLGSASALAVALVLDTADGHLARLQATASEFGRWLDAWLDEVGDMALHAAIAWSAYARDGSPGWLLAGMAYGMGKYVCVVGATGAKSATGLSGEGAAAPAFSALRSFVRLAGHADVRWHLWIVLAAFGRLDLALAAYAVYFPARSVLAAAGKAVRRD